MRKFLLTGLCLLVAPMMFAQQGLNNDAVLKMVKSGLSDDLIVTTINASPGSYDTTANGLIALKTGGASDKVISAVVVRAAGAGAAPAAAALAGPAASGRPAGIDDVGVYYKDKTGAWVALNPEIVNFKTGGVLKSVATAGI